MRADGRPSRTDSHAGEDAAMQKGPQAPAGTADCNAPDETSTPHASSTPKATRALGFANVLRQSPKRAAALAILVLMSMVLSFVEFPLVPGAEWLKYDPSGVIVLFAALLYGPWTGVGVAVLAWIPHLVTDPLGAFMNIASSVSVAIVMGYAYRQKPVFSRAVTGALAGTAASVLLSIGLNFVVTPLYLSATYEMVAALVLPTLLPFNVLKCLINSAIALVSYRKLASLIAEESTPL